MSQQIQITGGAKVRNLEGVLTGTAGVVNALGINVPSGIPQLDGSGKILVSQLPNSVMEYKGTWNAATNTPTLVNGTGNAGDVYLCNVAGTVNFGAGPIMFAIGDQVLYSGTTWERASGATGTVTSVAVTESGDALSITGSPITTSGTINIGFNGTSGQYVNGAGGLTTFPSLTGYVPYTGATQAVNLGAYDLTVNELTVGKGTSGLSNNTALGHQALFHITTGNYNTGVGHESLHNTSTGQYNTAIGQSSLFTNTTGSQNTALGLNALLYNTTGGSNVVVGLDGMQHNTTGSSNTALGYNAGSHITGGSTPNTTASNSIYIGRDSKAKVDGGANEIVIGYNAIGNGSNTATFGNTSTTANYFTGSINGGSFVKSGGTSSQFLKADGSVDSSTYLTTSAAASTYLPLTGGTLTGGLGGTSAAFSGTLGVTGNVSLLGNLGAKYGIIIEKGNTPATLSLNDVYISASSGTTNSLKIQNTNYLSTLNFAQSNQTFTFPEASGTLALTSNLSSYLPLTGGTLSGALNVNVNSGTGLNVATENVVFRASPTYGFPRQLVFSMGSGPTTTLEAKGYGGNYITDFNIITHNASGTPFNVFFGTAQGDVGIGTNSPTSYSGFTTLHLNGKSGNQGGLLRLTAFNDSSSVNIYASDGIKFNTTSAVPYIFLTQDTERLRITSGGNVGIGTSDVSSYNDGFGNRLVLANTSGSTGLTIVTSTGGNGNIYFADGTSGDQQYRGIIAYEHANDAMRFSTQATERMRITSGGEVLMNTSSTLTAGWLCIAVASNNYNAIVLKDTGTSYSSGNYYQVFTNSSNTIAGSIAHVTATTVLFNTSSDYRLKEDLKDFNGLEILSNIKFYDFKWKNEDIRMHGVIAHELQEIVPLSVSGKKDELNDEGNIAAQGVDYSKLVPILGKAIQELKAEMKELKSLIAAK